MLLLLRFWYDNKPTNASESSYLIKRYDLTAYYVQVHIINN